MGSGYRGVDARDLRFDEVALKALAFLTDAGFSVASKDLLRIIYESDAWFLDVFYTRGSHRLSFKFGRRSDPEDFVTDAEISAYVGQALPTLQPETRARMETDILVFAEWVERHVLPLRGHEQELWDGVSQARHFYTQAFTRSSPIRKARMEARDAAARGDYRIVAEKFAIVEDYEAQHNIHGWILTDEDRSLLDEARRRFS